MINIHLINLGLVFRAVVVIKIFSGFIETLEEIHHVPQSNIDFQIVDVFENLSTFAFAMNILGVFRSVEAVLFLIQGNDLSDCFFLGPYIEKPSIV